MTATVKQSLTVRARDWLMMSAVRWLLVPLANRMVALALYALFAGLCINVLAQALIARVASKFSKAAQ